MNATDAPVRAREKTSLARQGSVLLYRNTKLALGLVLVYIASLAALLVTAFWTVNSFTGDVVFEFSFDNFAKILTQATYQAVTFRTVALAIGVTLIDVAIAVPLAYFMAKVASPGWQRFLLISVSLPLWASYLVKAYAWRSVLSEGGILNWMLSPFGIPSIGYGIEGTLITLSYLWLPFVVIPIYAAFSRVPNSLLEASSDLGAKGWRTFRSVALPLVVPGIIAGSIFSFSLTLGDYIAVKIVGGATQTLGTLIYSNVGTANNLPLAAAIAFIPLVAIFAYLAAVRRTGALENL
jgi:putative spermidine/putrescine transport system permease protein